MNLKRIIPMIIAIFAAISLSACGENVSTDEIGAKYSGGSVEGKKFDKIAEPGTVDTWNNNDPIYRLPLSQITYTVRVDKDKDKGNDPDVDSVISVPVLDPETKISTELEYELGSTFKLNTHTNDVKGFEGGTFRNFFEDLCRAYKCWLDDNSNRTAGWRKMLREKLYVALQAALKDNARKYPPENQVNNVAVTDPENPSGEKVPTLSLLERDAARSFIGHLKRQVGGQFFCGPSFKRNVRNKDGEYSCPAPEMLITSVDYANKEIRTSREAKQVAKNLNDTQGTLAESIKNPDYLRYLEIQAMEKCAQNSKAVCVFGGSEHAGLAGR